MNGRDKRRKIIIIITLLILVFIFSVLIFFAVHINGNHKLNISMEASTEPKEDGVILSNDKKNETISNDNIEVNKTISNDVIVIELSEENCEYKEEKEAAIISKYEGDEDCIIIPAEIDGKKVEKIEEDAFKQCYNLETIKVPVELEDAIAQIEYFEVNEENSDKEYIELTTTREYSEIYNAYMSLTDEEKEKVLINPYKFEILETEDSTFELSASSLVSKYDVRDYIPVEVENQGSHGTCYAYSALSSLEIWIAKNRGELVDFSEIHAGVYSNGAGGFFSNVKSYINSNDGPVWEADWGKDTYADILTQSDYNMINSYLSGTSYSDSDINQMKGLLSTREVEGEIESESYLLPSNDTIKNHIMTYGSLCSYYYHDNAYLNTNYNGYTVYNYTGSILNMPDHAVCIIGWDDNFSRNNFPEAIRPKNNGAFLVLNSWGEDWGTDGGCFWVSYEDTWLGFHEAIGVTNVIGLGNNIKLNNMIIKDADTGIQVENINNMKNIVRRSIPIEVNLDLRYTSNNKLVNPNELKITLRNLNENLNIKPTVTSKNGYIVFNIDTSNLSINTDYIIDIEYNGEIISKSIRIISEYDYEIRSDNTIKLTAYKGKDKADIVVPQTIDGKIVRELASNLFYNNKAIETLTIYSDVKVIGLNIAPSGIIIFGNSGSVIKSYAKDYLYTFVEVGTDNIFGAFWKFNIPNRTLEINGEMEEYTVKVTPWQNFQKLIYKLIIGENVKEITNYAFGNCYNLEIAEGFKNIDTIGIASFKDCIKLKKIDNLSNVVNIKRNAFSECASLTDIGKLINLEEIGYEVFDGCISLECVSVSCNIQAQEELEKKYDFELEIIHNYLEEIVEPTCIQNGYKATTCTRCGDSYDIEEIEALGHTETIVNKVEPTCTENGLTEGKKCSVCDEILVPQEEIALVEHNYKVKNKTEAVCEKGGKIEYECERCKDIYEEIIEAKGHTEVIDYKVEATCTESGLTEGKHCAVCDKILVAQRKIEALGHNYEIINNVDAVCEKGGVIEYECIRCKDTYEEVVIAKGHIEVVDVKVEATCTESGLTEGKHCKVCNKILVEQEVIDPNGHNYKVKRKVDSICEKNGFIRYECIKCEDTYEEEIIAKGHNIGDWIIAKEATYEQEGYKYKICTQCKVKVEEEKIPKLIKDKLQISTQYTIKEINNIKYIIVPTLLQKHEILNNIYSNKEIEIQDKSGNIINSTSPIGTGSNIIVKENNEKIYTIVIKGDINGDGKIDFISDIIKINNYRLKLINLDVAGILAGDLNGNGKIDFISDIIKINNYRLGLINRL